MRPVAIGAAKDEPLSRPVAPERETKIGTSLPKAQKSFDQLSLRPADWRERVIPPTLITPSTSCGQVSVSFGALPPAATTTHPAPIAARTAARSSSSFAAAASSERSTTPRENRWTPPE